ncbi:MAG: hypothetical protein C5B52_17065 [Bacteroidetes bacterium]|nr:MAG: hypothetical protein C5B52_17065 [Bacteroidota bacterium]
MKQFHPGIKFLFFAICFLGKINSYCQDSTHHIPTPDTSVKVPPKPKDSAITKKTVDTTKKKSAASKAALRSAIIPGWGQAYNKKYWKVPIVWGALAIPIVTFSYNVEWYKKTKYAYTVKYYNDTANFANIDPKLQPLSPEALKTYRNEFRQNVDYSVLAFLILWGLNVVDAAVDAHLKDFNISNDLSFKVKPWLPSKNVAGISLVFNIGKNQPKTITSLR